MDYPANGMVLVGPKGLPEPVIDKVAEAFKKVSEGPAFHKVLTNFDLSYEYKDRAQLGKEIPVQYEYVKGFLTKIGVKKEG